MTNGEFIAKAKKMKFMKLCSGKYQNKVNVGDVCEIKLFQYKSIENFNPRHSYRICHVGLKAEFILVTEKYAKEKGYYDKTGKFIEGVG